MIHPGSVGEFPRFDPSPRNGPITRTKGGNLRRFHARRAASGRRGLGRVVPTKSSHEWTDAFGGRRARARAEHRKERNR